MDRPCQRVLCSDLFCYLAVLGLALLSVSSESLWWDEMCRILPQHNDNFPITCRVAYRFAQPGYVFFMYGWIQLLGSTEILLRLSNVPFALLACCYALRIVKKNGWPRLYALLFFAHPMFVYYMNEATPYIMLYGFSMMFLYYVYYADDFGSRRNILLINLSFLAGVFIHFIFGFVFIFYACICWFRRKSSPGLLKRHLLGLLCFSVAYLPLLCVYICGLGLGSGGSARTGFGWKNILYVGYGFWGMAGLGISRNDLRAGNFNMIGPHHILLLVFAIVLGGLLAYWLLRNFRAFYAENRLLLLSLAVSFCVMFVFAWILKFGIWERHCSTFFPVYIILIGSILRRSITTVKPVRRKVYLSLYALMLVISMLNIRFNYYYSCDDHKGVYGCVERYAKAHGDFTLYIDALSDVGYYTIPLPGSVKVVQFHSGERMSDGEVSQRFREDGKGVLVLFEKEVGGSLYREFDHAAGYEVIDRYNSYKIIRHVE